MKKSISVIICIAMLLSIMATTLSVVAAPTRPGTPVVDVTQPTDVPKIIINTNTSITRDAYSACSITVVDEEGGEYENIVDDAASVKIRGNSTSSADKKPYNIKFSSKTDVLGMGKAKKWCLLANCYDKTLIRNAVVFDIAKELGVPYTLDYRFVDVYVNNELMGSFLLTEAVEVDSNRVDIDTDNNEYLLELDWNPEDEDCYYFTSYNGQLKFAINEPEKEDLTQEQIDYVEGLVADAESALRSGDYEEVQKYFDIESMSNFYLLLEFFRNVDVNTSSTRFHIKNGKIYGGPAWDFDLSSGNYNANYYTGMYSSNGTCYKGLHATSMKWFGKLTGYAEFQNQVVEKFQANYALFENIFMDNGLGQNRIDTMLETYEATFSRNHNEAGWTPDKVYNSSLQLERTPDATYEANVEYYRDWLEGRTDWLYDTWGLEPVDCQHTETITVVNDDESQDIYCKGCGLVVDHIDAPCKHPNEIEVPMEDGSTEIRCEDCGELLDVIPAPAPNEYDVNGDDNVDLFDYFVIKTLYFNPNAEVEEVAKIKSDVNADGSVDMFDYMIIKQYIFA